MSDYNNSNESKTNWLKIVQPKKNLNHTEHKLYKNNNSNTATVNIGLGPQDMYISKSRYAWKLIINTYLSGLMPYVYSDAKILGHNTCRDLDRALF